MEHTSGLGQGSEKPSSEVDSRGGADWGSRMRAVAKGCFSGGATWCGSWVLGHSCGESKEEGVALEEVEADGMR